MLWSDKRRAEQLCDKAWWVAHCGVFVVATVQWEVSYSTLNLSMDIQVTSVKTGLNFY